MADAAPIVGIDLGTTNSLVAVAGFPPGDAAAGAPRILPDDRGRPLVPSAVRFEADGTTVIGYDARDRAVEFPCSTVVSVKRLMGRSLGDAAGDLKYLSYHVVEGPNRTARIEIPANSDAGPKSQPTPLPTPSGRGSRTVSPQEVSAIILRRLKEQASRALGVEARRAVVTVPAYFD